MLIKVKYYVYDMMVKDINDNEMCWISVCVDLSMMRETTSVCVCVADVFGDDENVITNSVIIRNPKDMTKMNVKR